MRAQVIMRYDNGFDRFIAKRYLVSRRYCSGPTEGHHKDAFCSCTQRDQNRSCQIQILF